MTQPKTTRDRVDATLEQALRIACHGSTPAAKARRVVAREALAAWRDGCHPIEAAYRTAGEYAHDGKVPAPVKSAAMSEARTIDAAVSNVLNLARVAQPIIQP